MGPNRTDETHLRLVFSQLADEVTKFRRTMHKGDRQPVLTGTIEPAKMTVLAAGTLVEYEQSSAYQSQLHWYASPHAVQAAIQQVKGAGFYGPAEDAFLETGQDPIRAQMNVGSFITEVLNRETDTNELVRIIVDEILHKPATWKMVMFVLGLSVSAGVTTLGQLTVRKPVLQDFVQEMSVAFSRKEATIQNWPARSSMTYPYTSVVEWEQEGIPRGFEHEDSILSKVNGVVTRLRLLKSGSFQVTGWSARTVSLTEPGKLWATNRPQNDPFMNRDAFYSQRFQETLIGPNDAALYQRLESRAFLHMDTDSHIANRVGRATWALNEMSSRNAAEALLFGIIGLESLFLSEEQELRLRLALRAAGMLSRLGEDSYRVYQDILKAYSIRNKLVHDDATSQSLIIEAAPLVPHVTEYLRKGALAWLQVKCAEPREVEQLWRHLETSFIDPEAMKIAASELVDIAF